MEIDNKSFDSKRIAQGYQDRPFLHKQVMERFRKDIGDRSFINGLDVGCGAGLSSKGLHLLCGSVTGTDISPAMIEAAREACGTDSYTFFCAKAEDTPIPDRLYDIVSAAGVISWIDREAFLSNMSKVMAQGGILFIYDFGITDRMIGQDAYCEWWYDQYLREFPKPSRNEKVWTDEDVRTYGFHMIKQINYEMQYRFSLEKFVDFMMIQSNVNGKIEGGIMGADEARNWFWTTLRPIFRDKMQILVFTGYSWYLEKGRPFCESW